MKICYCNYPKHWAFRNFILARRTLLYGVLFSICLSCATYPSLAQIEWAARATDLQGTRIESFDKLLGAPDSYLEESQSEFAWTAYFEQGGEVKEILIQFEKAIPVRKIFVVENFGIGLKEVFLIDEQGGEREKFSLNQNFDFRLNIISKISHITLYKQTDYKVKFLRIVVHEPFSASEVCQVDATGISSEDVHYLFPPRHVIARRQLAAKFPFTLNYQLLDHENQQPLVGAEVVLTDLITQLKDTLVTDNEGRVVKPLTHSKFSLQVAREGYFVGNDYTFSTLTYEKGTIVTQNATVRRFQPGKSFVFYGLFSTPNAVALTEKDMQILEKILKT